MNAREKIEQLIADLIGEGTAVLNTKRQPGGNWVSGPPNYVDLAAFTK